MIDDIPIDVLGHAIDFHCVGLVNGVEQGGKRIAEIETASAAVANIKDSFEFLEQGLLVIECVRLPVERVARWRLEATFAPAFRVAHFISGEKRCRTGWPGILVNA